MNCPYCRTPLTLADKFCPSCMAPMSLIKEYFRRPIKFQVLCPAGQLHCVRTMYMDFIFRNGEPFPLPCNGCDEANGSRVCEECMAKVTLLFLADPSLDISKPLLLD